MLQSSKKSIIIFLVNSGNYFGAEKINVKIDNSVSAKADEIFILLCVSKRIGR